MDDVVILGGGAKARCLDLDMDCEIWGVNMQHTRGDFVPRWDRMFNLHKYDLLKQYGYPCYRDAEWARDHPHTRVYTMDQWPDKRMRAELFPWERLTKEYPRGRYHCNSLDWLILFALDQGFLRCHLNGWSLERDGIIEQMSSPKCAEYWAGYATAKGMEIIPTEDTMMFGKYHIVKTDRLYGLDDSPAWEDRTKEGVPYRYDDF